MKTRKTIALAAVALGAFAFGTQEASLLRRDLKENSSETYRIESKMDLLVPGTPFGDVDVKAESKIVYALTTGKADGVSDATPADMVTTFEEVKVGGSLAGSGAPKKPDPIKASGTIDSRNRLKVTPATSKSPEEALAALGMGSLLNVLFAEFPERAVKVGDTWDITIPKSPVLGKQDQKLAVTFVKEVGDTVHLRIAGNLTSEVDLAALGAGSLPADLKLALKQSSRVEGEALVLKATGRTKKLDMTVEAKGTIDVNEGAMEFPSSSKTTFNVKLSP